MDKNFTEHIQNIPSPPFAYPYFNYHRLFDLRNNNSKILGNLPMANMFGFLVLVKFTSIKIHVICIAHRRNLNLLQFPIPTFRLQFLLWVQTYMVELHILLKWNLAFLHNLSSKSISISIKFDVSLVYQCYQLFRLPV